jgi:hypothetical protein
MDATIRSQLDNLHSEDKALQNQAFMQILALTSQPVDWAYEAWPEMLENLKRKDNHLRAIAAQVLCNLAKSDPQQRMLKDFDTLLYVTKDERFVTARHCLQSLWKIGAVGKAQQEMLVAGLSARFAQCSAEKNCTLIRYDILEGFKKLYGEVKDDSIRQKALALIETEPDLKYRKKYTRLWEAH